MINLNIEFAVILFPFGTRTLRHRVNEITADFPHWNSCLAASSKDKGPSPNAIALPAYTPFFPREANMIVVFMSSSNSGPSPPISLSADVRTA
ncbi:hypothetical protein PBCV1_a223aL [Paramecium bursaria Chlorella virus 1]|uniref:Uncharacterized protein n=1 Tax=Paramecium bursaria Chlorella virus 1 TaxID=10506 RepID=Q84543_PBCV1|nr:hypothetical protein PBCV1_a223aL [Paramecium bursaria Chlorella virus 1]AAC96591.2 hypothetical protein [Paramecium bursaria Chlorella virus 1]